MPTHVSTRVSRRIMAFVVAATVALSGIITLAPVPASAQLHNIFPADDFGTPIGALRADENLYVTMTSDTKGGRVCVVATDTVLSGTESINCASSTAWGKAKTFVGVGTLLGVPLEFALLPPGKYRLMAEAKNGAGKFVGSELSEEFEVRPCSGGCDLGPANAQRDAWKSRAEHLAPRYEMISTATHTVEIGSAVSAARGMYAMAGGGLAGMMLGGAWGGLNYAVPMSSEAMAMAILKDLSAQVGQMWADIAADPPDYNYDAVADPVLVDLPVAGDDLLDAINDASMRAGAYGDASRIAFERWQGAMEHENDEAARIQAQATAEFTFELNRQLRRLSELQPQLSNLTWAQEGVSQEHYTQALAARAEIAEDGHTPEQEQQLRDLGFSEASIAQIEADYAASDPVGFDPTVPIGALVSEVTDALEATIDDYDAFGRAMAVTASEHAKNVTMPDPDPENQSPVASFIASVTEGTVPLEVTFTNTSTDPDDDELTLYWDIAGEADFTDEQTVTYTFDRAAIYYVGLTATDPSGALDQAVQEIKVYPDTGEPGANSPPVASFTPTQVEKTGPITQIFDATASTDPDGDELTYTWYFGDGTTLTGEQVTHTFPAGFISSVLLVVSDGKATDTLAGEVVSLNSDGTFPGDDNSPPIASFTTTPDSGDAPLEVAFTATSTDPDGDALTHTWHFGDGHTATGATTIHTYEHPGTYTATLIADDGNSTHSETTQITVSGSTEPLTAAFTTAQASDAAKSFNGAKIVATSGADHPSRPATNLLHPSGFWQSAPHDTAEREIIIALAGDGRELIDRVVLEGSTSSSSVKTFSIATTDEASPFGGYTEVVSRAEHVRTGEPQEFTFPVHRARFLKLTVHDNHGHSYHSLREVSVPAIGSVGAIVSSSGGPQATILSVSSEHRADTAGSRILERNNSAWQTSLDDVVDQEVIFSLGGQPPHMIDRVHLRGKNSSNSAKSVEIYLSVDGTTWSKVAEGELARAADPHEFAFTAVPATQVKIRVLDNHGGRYLELTEAEVLTVEGLDVANGAGVGAGIVDFSSQYSATYSATEVLGPDPDNSRWSSATVTDSDEHFTVVLRNSESVTIDRVSVRSITNRPRNVAVETSMDGVSFSEVARRELFDISDVQQITFEATEAKFVRLRMLDGYSSQYLSVTTFRVYAALMGGSHAVTFADLSRSPDVHSWAWDFGDGTTSTDQHPTHTFPGPGTYDVALTITDGDGATSSITHPYTVLAVPDLSITAPTHTPDENATIPLTASGAGFVEWEWNLDYTKPSASVRTINARFPDDGEYTVTVRGRSAEGFWTAPAAKDFDVQNVPPTVSLQPFPGIAGVEISPKLGPLRDPADTFTCVLDWGDGTSDTIESCSSGKVNQLVHVYETPGTYTATLTADDGDGGVTTDTAEVTMDIPGSFLQVVSTEPQGTGLSVRGRLHHLNTNAGAPGQEVVVSAGGATTTAVTDSEGYAEAVLPGAVAAQTVNLEFAGSDRFLASEPLSRPVRAPAADIVFMVDESGSMGGKQKALISRMQEISQGLGSHLDYRLGLVGYANMRPAAIMTPLTADMTEFYRGLGQLRVVSGASANSFDAVLAGTGDDAGFRDVSAKCGVILTDAPVSEARGAYPESTKERAVAALEERSMALFSVITTDQDTLDAYGSGEGLAGQSGGDWWDINVFTNDASEVLEALVTQCVLKASTPDLSVTKEGPVEELAPGDTAEYTLTVANEAVVDVTGVALVDALPEGVEFLSASGSGAFDAESATVSWPAFTLEPTETATRTVQVRMPTGLTPGSHELVNTATVSDDGSHGPESTLDNNTDTHPVTLVVPVPPDSPDVGVTKTTLTPAGVEPGATLTYALTVTNHGTADADDVTLLDEVPAQWTVIGLEGHGWTNPNGGDLVGPHPDGSTPGTWLHLTRVDLEAEASSEVTVTVRVSGVEQPAVIDDDGTLGENLPDLARVDAHDVTGEVCVSAAEDPNLENDCAALTVPLRDLVAEVTVRLFGGITHLIVSVDTTEVLADEDITVTWTPAAARTTAGEPTDPEGVVVTALERRTHHVYSWPGGTLDVDARAAGWPGWRAVEEEDLDGDGNTLHPATGEVMTPAELEELFRGTLILDETEVEFPWRGQSTINFSVNPEAGFAVTYREDVPTENAPGPDPERTPTPTPGPDPTPTPDPEPTPEDSDPSGEPQEDVTETLPEAAGEEIPQTGANLVLLPLGVVFLLLGLLAARIRLRTTTGTPWSED